VLSFLARALGYTPPTAISPQELALQGRGLVKMPNGSKPFLATERIGNGLQFKPTHKGGYISKV
jgi:hypothetical protein